MAQALAPPTPDTIVYPVEFTGYKRETDDGKTVLEIQTIGPDNVKWCVFNLQSVRRAIRLKESGKDRNAKPDPHPTRRIQYYYRKEDAEAYRDEPGFVLHPPVKRGSLTGNQALTSAQVRAAKNNKARDTTTADVPVPKAGGQAKLEAKAETAVRSTAGPDVDVEVLQDPVDKVAEAARKAARKPKPGKDKA